MVFCFVHNIFSDNTRVRIFFFQNKTLGYMTKTLNHIFFFPSPKSEFFFQQHWESEYFFRNKTIPPFKLNGRSPIYTFFFNISLVCQ
jgi:hypothetical protein